MRSTLSVRARRALSLHTPPQPPTLTEDPTGGLQVTSDAPSPPPPITTTPPSAPLSQQPNPFTTSNYLSILFLHLLTPLLTLGRKRPLTLDDLWQAVPADRTEVVHARLEEEWEAEVRQAKLRQRLHPASTARPPSLFRALRRSFGWRMYLMFALEVLYYLFYGTIPFTMRALVTYIYAPGEACSYYSVSCSWVYSLGLGLAVLCSSIAINHKFYHAYRVGSQMRSALMATVYAKALRLSSASRAHSTSGETVNLMTNDCGRVFDAVLFFNTLIVAPGVIVVALGLLIYEVGVAAVAAVGLMLVIIPYQVWTARQTSSYRKSMLRHTDARVKFISEILQGIRIVKMMAWEEPMGRTIAGMRERELACLHGALLLKALNLGILFVYPACVTFVTFVVYAYMGNEVVPANVFIVLSFLTLIRFPVSLMPQAITFTSEAKVGLDRIQAFLMQEELQSIERARDHRLSSLTSPSPHTSEVVPVFSLPVLPSLPLPRGSILIERGTFRWSKDNAVPILSSLHLSIQPGELVGVIGSVGCGKSSLLSALLGEMEADAGSVVRLEGQVALLSQKPWIRNQTVRDNITFGLPYDAERYQQSVTAAALLPDFAMMTAGDSTEIGEQGLNLSGGQKARISLARGLYRAEMTDVYLLDDVMSAVDMAVGKQMFERGVMGMLGGKTRVMVLNSHLHCLESCHRIVVVERDERGGGKLAACGPYAEISAKYPHLLQALDKAAEEEEEEEEQHVIFDPKKLREEDGVRVQKQPRPSEVIPFHLSELPKGSISTTLPSITAIAAALDSHEVDSPLSTTPPAPSSPVKPTPAPPSPPPAATSGALISIESSGQGDIPLSVYLKYFQAASGRFGVVVFGLILFSYIGGQVTRIMSDYWLVRWGADNNSPPPAHGTEWWILTWAGFIAGAFVFALSRAVGYSSINVRSSMSLHNRVFALLMRAPVNLFFDVTPAGRVVNLMSKDLEQVDTLLPGYLHEFVLYAFQFTGTIVLACVVTYYFIPIIAPIVGFFVWIQTFFRATSRELKRLEGRTRSPIFSSFGETLQGLQVIRAYGVSAAFIRENEARVDVNSRVFLMGYLAERWLSIRLEVCSFLVILAVALLTSNLRGTINPTLAGLTLNYALQMTGLLQLTVRLSIQTEGAMTAVERLNAFDELPQEAPYERPGAVPSDWPHAGTITFRDAKLRYRPELDLVMRGISCSVASGEKIGICGRTGSGKSTLMVALFRLVELAAGSVEIDGHDISQVGLARLRSSLSIIPQDAVLFSGTLRYNIDPFHEHDDAAIWQALERVGLAVSVRALPGGIDAAVAEGGDNFSHGQKQLVCIARALLRRTRILILDEATASIDPASDRALQDTLATSFADCTVLTIAHRLQTIVDYHRVMVLRDGLIAEFDRPSRLLRQRSSLFYSMVSEGGPALVEQMLRIADRADEAREKVEEAKAELQGKEPSVGVGASVQQFSSGERSQTVVARASEVDDDAQVEVRVEKAPPAPPPGRVRVERVRGDSIYMPGTTATAIAW